MDIQSTSSAAAQGAVGTGQAGAVESAVNEARQAADSEIERREAEPSETGRGVGERVDVQA